MICVSMVEISEWLNLGAQETHRSLNRNRVFILVLGVLMLCATDVWAQRNKEETIHDYLPSENVDLKKKFKKKSNAPKTKKYSLIVKNKADGLLYGNACMTENTHRMGFEYSIQVKGLPGSLYPWERRWKNVLVHTKLIFTRGPWWKLVLNKRVKNCRQKSGDFVG